MRTNFIPRNAFLYLQVFAFTLAWSHGLQLDFWALAVIQAADGWKCSLKSVCGWWITPYTWPLLHTRHQTQSEHYQPEKPCQASPYLERFPQGLLYGQMAKSGECRKPAKQKREWLKSTGLVGKRWREARALHQFQMHTFWKSLMEQGGRYAHATQLKEVLNSLTPKDVLRNVKKEI